ncbi:MAG TPA: branched-chain amino acid ABC transporter permease, partial [Pyrinomonadaceae bacterium]
MDTFVQQLINGLTIGSIYALIALGYTMVYGILRLINFAHGDIYMLGAYSGYFIAHWLGFASEPSVLGLAVVLVGSMGAAALIGMAIERFAYRPVRKYARMTTLITAIGVSLLLENLGVVIFGGTPRAFPELLRNETYRLFGNAAISKTQLLIFGVSIVLMVLLQWIVYRT